MEILLYTRRGCHLCEEAEDIVAAIVPGTRLVGIDGEPGLVRYWGARVPALVVDGHVVAEGRFDEGEITLALVRLRAP